MAGGLADVKEMHTAQRTDLCRLLLGLARGPQHHHLFTCTQLNGSTLG